MTSTVEVLPETNDTTLFVRLSGIVTLEDYMANFDAPVRSIAKNAGYYNLLVLYAPDFQGWSKEAASASFKCITEIASSARKLAYVSPPEQRILLMKMMRPIIQADTQFFNDNELAHAIRWMNASPTG